MIKHGDIESVTIAGKAYAVQPGAVIATIRSRGRTRRQERRERIARNKVKRLSRKQRVMLELRGAFAAHVVDRGVNEESVRDFIERLIARRFAGTKYSNNQAQAAK